MTFRTPRVVVAVLAAVVAAVPVRADAAALSEPAAPVAPRAYQRGMTIWAWEAGAYAAPANDAALAHLAALGVTHVTFVPTWFQATATSSTFEPRAGFTATDAALRHGIATAKARGLHVTVKPHIDRSDGGWRGDIRPADRDRWFGRYDAFLRHYARLTASAGAHQLVVGTELAGVSGDTTRWRRLVRSARSSFRGSLTYAALPFEYGRIAFWDALDAIGVDAYWPLSDRPETDVARLRAAWQPIVAELAAASARWRRPVLFTEAGYASQVGTATNPSSWTLSSTPAPAEQAAAYQALLESFEGQPWFAGVHWWAWRAPNVTEPLDFTPQGKPAEDLLRARWGG